MIKAQNLGETLTEDCAKVKAALQRLYEMFDITDFIDEDGDGVPDSEEETDPIDIDGGIEIIDWTGGE